jgi:uncharacterized protein DUF1236
MSSWRLPAAPAFESFKENPMTRYFGGAAVALALVAGTADAQTVMERQITSEPVETIIERGPAGTVITRRPLDTSVPGAATRLPSDTFVSEPIDTRIESRETTGVSAARIEPPAAAATVQRATVRRRPADATPRPARTASRQAVRKTTTQRGPIAQRTRMRATPVRAAPVAATPAPMLTAAQRSRIYQTVIRERVVPRTFITERVVTPGPIPIITPPVVRERVIEQVITDPASDPFVTERIVTAPPRETFGAAPFVPFATEGAVTTQAAIDLTVGSRVPATVPIYALPETLARQVPAARPYRYVIVDDRVLLVDPLTNVVVAELDQ